MAKLTATAFKLNAIKQLKNSVSNTANTLYYLYVSQHIDNANLSVIKDTTENQLYGSYDSMLFGKKVSTSDVALVVKNVPYTPNKVYTMYEHDVELFDKDFYCVVDEDSFSHVYKCLDNNFNSVSNVEPSFTYFSSADNFTFRTTDGYLWKYMYSVAYPTIKKFASTDYFPVYINADVSSNAINGSIDVVKILDTGRGYDNYYYGTFASADLRINGNNQRYRINKIAANGFFTGCVLYISSGVGSGQYATITDYFSNENGSFIDIDAAFSTAPQNQSEYQITPKVNFRSNGKETLTAIGRALVNASSSNSLYRVEMLRNGSDYEYATCTVSANVNVGVEKTASLKPIISPKGGHGKDAEKELFSSRICFSVKLTNTENGTIIANNTFKQLGILKDPLFAQTVFTISNATASFTTGETIYRINPVRVQTNVTVNTLSTTVTSSNAMFTTQLSENQFVYINGHESSYKQLAKIQSISNSTHLTLTTNCNFTSTNAEIYIANVSSFAKVVLNPTTTSLTVNAVYGKFGTNDIIIGEESGSKANVESVSRSDVTKGFDTFIQMYKYTGVRQSGSFTADDTIYQGTSLANSTANATLHSFVLDGENITMYLSNVKGNFNIALPFYGVSSGVALMDYEFDPELLSGSGDILYSESIENIARTNSQTEEFKIVFEF